jgi:unsaturated rhamnogalacturonyl hydrolase
MKKFRTIRIILFVIVATLMTVSCGKVSQKSRISNADISPLEWSIQIAESEIARHDSLIKSTGSPNKWQYDIALLAGTIAQLSDVTGDDKYFNYMKTYMDYYVNPDGTARYYTLEEYSLDRIRPAVNLFTLWHKTGDDRYKTAIQNHIKQLETHPRTSDGGYWHKKIYPYQMWLDGLFMAMPFAAQYGAEFNEPKWFDKAVHQITLVYKHTLDSKTRLLYHAWDENCEQRWSNPKTGQSPHFWSRAMGWYLMSMVDVLDFLPVDHPGRPEVIDILNKVSEALLKVRDPESNLWYQVTNAVDREGNYLEASGLAMFAYTFAKSIQKGYLPPKYLDEVRKTYQGIVIHLINIDEDDLINLEQTCGGCGLGSNSYRDGSIEYYITETIVQNDTKGVAPFILTGILLNNN